MLVYIFTLTLELNLDFFFICICISEKNIKDDNFAEMEILKMPENKGFLF